MASSDKASLLEAAVEQSDFPVSITTAELEPPGPAIVYVNEAFLRLTGYTREKLVGATPRIHQGPATDRSVLDRLKANLRAGDSFQGATWNYRRDGTPYRVEWTVTPLRLAGEEVDYFFAVQRDVTASYRIEAGLEDQTRRMSTLLHSAGSSESFTDLSARLAWLIDDLENQVRERTRERTSEAESARDQSRSILESSPVGIGFLDHQCRIQRVNPALEDILGYSADQLLGYDTRFLHRDHSEFERVGREAYPVMVAGGVYRTVVPLERGDGTPITVSLKGQAVNPSGDGGFIWVLQDITERRAREQALQTYRAVFESSRDAIALVTEDGSFADCNPAALALYAVADRTTLTRDYTPATLSPTYQPDGRPTTEAAEERIQQALEQGLAFFEWQSRSTTGRTFPAEVLLSRVDLDDGPILQATIRDVSEKNASFDTLREAHERAEAYFENVPVMVLVLDTQGRVSAINQRGCDLLGLAREAIVGKDWFARFVEGATEDRLMEISEAFDQRREVITEYVENALITAAGEHRLMAFHSTLLRDAAGRVEGLLASGVDITEQRRMEAEIERQAFHDGLTGLPTRNGLVRAIDAALESPAGCAGATLVVLDLEGMHDVNDIYGFAAGDRLLIAVGERLCAELGDDAVVARVGGDSFAVFLPAGDDAVAVRRRDALAHALERPFVLEDGRIEIHAYYGYTVIGRERRPTDVLVREAELALFQSRAVAGNRWFAHTPDLDAASRRRIEITRELRGAIANDEFELYFQPKVDLETGAMVAAEALIRWRHPERGLQSPATFIPVAEQSQLIGPIGDWALREACRLLAEWQAEGLGSVRIAVNISLLQFQVGDFAATVADAIEAYGIDTGALTLEITESVFEQDSEQLLAQLLAIHDLGVHLSLDDFGTGYSSLLYLHRYPFDEIKIDQGFVRGMRDDGYSHRIVTAVIAIARGLDVDLVAEGIETPDLAEPLLALGCRVGQGYYYSMPLATEDFRWLLEQPTALPMAMGDKP